MKPARRRKKCGAKARTTGKPCERWALVGKERCRLHGGKSTGPPMTKGGRYCKNLHVLRPRFEAALADPELLEGRREIAMMDVVLGQLVERIERQDTPGWRNELQRTFTRLTSAMQAGNAERVGTTIQRLGALIEQGAEADRVVRDLIEGLDKRSARAQKEREVNIKGETVTTMTDMMVIFGQWVDVLRRHLDEKTFRTVLPELRSVS